MCPLEIHERKRIWRRAYSATRSARRIEPRSANPRRKQPALSAEELQKEFALPPESTLASYVPLHSEVDVRCLSLQWCQEFGPVTVPTAESTASGRYTEPAWVDFPCREGSMGGEHLRADPALLEVSLVLVPGLAFDLSGQRLGRGAGWYDRALRFLPGNPIRVGVCFDEEVVATGVLPTEDHDLRMDALLTPTRLLSLVNVD